LSDGVIRIIEPSGELSRYVVIHPFKYPKFKNKELKSICEMAEINFDELVEKIYQFKNKIKEDRDYEYSVYKSILNDIKLTNHQLITFNQLIFLKQNCKFDGQYAITNDVREQHNLITIVSKYGDDFKFTKTNVISPFHSWDTPYYDILPKMHYLMLRATVMNKEDKDGTMFASHWYNLLKHRSYLYKKYDIRMCLNMFSILMLWGSTNASKDGLCSLFSVRELKVSENDEIFLPMFLNCRWSNPNNDVIGEEVNMKYIFSRAFWSGQKILVKDLNRYMNTIYMAIDDYIRRAKMSKTVYFKSKVAIDEDEDFEDLNEYDALK
jgi:hypothetical protein